MSSSKVELTVGPDGGVPEGHTVSGIPAELVDRYRREGLWTEDTLDDLLVEAARRWPDRPAVSDRYRRVTYAQLDAAVDRAARVLAARGIGVGDAVVVHLPNSVAFVETVFAVHRLGAVPVFALAAHGAAEVRHFVGLAPARAYVGPDRPGERFAAVPSMVRAEFPEVEVVLVADRVEDPWAAASGCALVERPEVPALSLAFFQLSGGTTGVPKLIPRTHAEYLYSVRASVEVTALTGDDVMLVVLPASHNFTMSSPGILGAFMVGAQVVLAADPSPSTCLPLIDAQGVTAVALVPPLLLAWLNSPLRERSELSSLRVLWVGGAKLSESVACRVVPELGCALQQVFGMAEGLVNYTRFDDDPELVLSTQGRPQSSWDEVLVVDDADVPVVSGEPGHLLTRGPYTIRRYHRAPEHDARSFTAEGFYRTGDVVRQLPSGHLVVVGRAKDQINRGGEKVAPEAVENELLAHPAVHDVSVVGLPDEVLGERVCAYVIVRDPGAADVPDARGLRQFLRARGLASFAIPDVVHLVREFPQTGVGKVSKRGLREDVELPSPRK
ncbi:2,3-dihydroxybenzoate-AMP ligase [Austwickia chelonae]|uniref:Putative 2,3-dihydroxybenzoate-AMP ligase n=1 Tax=Austwickia chelonae NBRC 105200 TaxID=1184607 RepID=K6V8F8_9MICO|nr:AMP-binding protein [Austwickia chelonae]GAB78483.1 putative 2,3-dihydroxybenzoate-AMP ligase [Austwickia chelonae NBRC 105200]SEW40019.1 2,3-dihydroxybenzoate-AMP ligase [Austwickia chelonae]